LFWGVFDLDSNDKLKITNYYLLKEIVIPKAFNELSKKTQDKYLQAYDKLMLWKASENIDKESFSEAVMLEYFHYLKSEYTFHHNDFLF